MMRSRLRSTAAKKISLRVVILIRSVEARTKLYCLAGGLGNEYGHRNRYFRVYRRGGEGYDGPSFISYPSGRGSNAKKTFRSTGGSVAGDDDRRDIRAKHVCANEKGGIGHAQSW